MEPNSLKNLMKSTAIYPNRLRNKKEVETKFELDEFGNEDKIFRTTTGLLIAEGYDRIVYGDHGPYIEFNKDQIIWDSWKVERKNIGYYNIHYPVDGTNVKLYFQRKDVKHLPNPPKGSRSFKGNREDGYADYVIGKCYISPFEFDLVINEVETCMLGDILI